MVRVHFNPARTDGVNYIPAGRLATTTGDSENSYSFVNQARTLMKFRINLKSILGTKEFNSKDMFSIKVSDIKPIVDASQLSPLINQVSPGWIRTSNLVMSGPNFLSDKKEMVMGQVGNFDPNEETSYEIEFHRGDYAWGGEYVLYFRLNGGGTANRDGQEFGHSVILPFAENQLEELATRRFRWNYRQQQGYSPGAFTDTNPSLEGKTIIITDAIAGGTGGAWLICQYDVVGETENVLRTGSNFPVTLSVLPNFPTWYMYKRDVNITNDHDYGIEAWFYKPQTDYIDITLELRDLLLNQLQPVMAVPADKVLPPFTFIFDIN